MDIKELEKTIWVTAKKLHNQIELYDCMHNVLGLVFLKYITDISDQKPNESLSAQPVIETKDEEREEHLSYNEFFVPKKAQWSFLLSNAKYAEIGILIDEVIDALEKLNENIRGILPKNYAGQTVNKTVLGELIQLIGNIGLGKEPKEKKEALAKVFEYLLVRFAKKGRIGDQAYTTQNIAQLLVEMVEPRKGVVYDGSCGAGNMFVHINKHVKKYRAKIENLSFYGQDSHAAVIKIGKMNLMIHDLEADLQVGDTFTTDCHSGVKADFILSSPAPLSHDRRANQPEVETRAPKRVNSNLAWLQQSVYKLNSTGVAGIVLPDNTLNSISAEERKIRQRLIESNLVDCIVSLPSQFFPAGETQASLWVLTKNKTHNKYTNPDNEVLFIDAGKMKVTGDKRERALPDESILIIARTYQRWKNINGDYVDRKGFCKAVTIGEISKNKYNLQPSKYIGRNRVSKAVPALVISMIAGLVVFMSSNNNSLISKSTISDTALTIEPKSAKDSVQPRRVDRTVKRKAKEEPVKEKDKSAIDAVQNRSVATTEETTEETAGKDSIAIPEPAVEKDTSATPESNLTNSYKVIDKAYFYNEPDESTRRRAFINHWNNSYAKIEAEDEKNGFIYVEFTNHLNQTSRGWLRKRDLKEVGQ